MLIVKCGFCLYFFYVSFGVYFVEKGFFFVLLQKLKISYHGNEHYIVNINIV